MDDKRYLGPRLSRSIYNFSKAKLRQLQWAGVNAGHLTFINADAAAQEAFEALNEGPDGRAIKGVYFWTSTLLGRPYDPEIEADLPDFNFWLEREAPQVDIDDDMIRDMGFDPENYSVLRVRAAMAYAAMEKIAPKEEAERLAIEEIKAKRLARMP